MPLKDELQKIVDEFSSARSESDQFVAEYNPGPIYAMRHGMIDLVEDIEIPYSTSWGGWASAKFSIGIKVGGRIPYETHKMISEKVKSLIGEGYGSQYGTAWSFYGKRNNGS